MSEYGNCAKCGEELKRVAYTMPSKGYIFGEIKGSKPLTVCSKCFQKWHDKKEADMSKK